MPSTGDVRASVPDAWDALARAYRWQEGLEHRSTDTLLRVLAPTAGEVVLDVGSGLGHLPRHLDPHLVRRRAGATAPDRRVVALERSSGMLAAGDYAGADLLRGDAARLPLSDASVDVVTAAWVLHVLTAEDRVRAVAEIARVLRPGGRLGAIVPAVPRNRGQQLVRVLARTGAHAVGIRAFEVPVDLPALLTDSGLQVRHHARTGRGYLADVVVCTRATHGWGDAR